MHHLETPRQSVLCLGAVGLATPGEDEIGLATGSAGGLDVLQGVANEIGLSQVQPQFGSGPVEQAGERLATGAPLIGPVGAEVEGIHPPTGLLNYPEHTPVDVLNSLQRDPAAIDPGLICDDNDSERRPGQAGEGLQCAG